MYNYKQSEMHLSLQDTNALKGIALFFLLWHHLFYTGEMLVDDITIGKYPFVLTTGIWCKVCVAIFVFLSGYGLTVSAERNGGIGNLWQFYRKRYLKLMINYWFVYLIFVPFGVFVMGRTFMDVYHGSLVRPILDFFGLHFAVTGDYYGYNATWWFYGCIMALYALFPLLYKLKSYWFILIPFAIVFNELASNAIIIHSCASYMLSFVLGISIAIRPLQRISGGGKNVLILLIAFVMISWYRLHCSNTHLWDAVISFSLVSLYIHLEIPSICKKTLAKIGEHSFNIFLFHTFIFSLYFKDYIYWSENPVLIFMTLLFTCIIISIVLEYIKEHLGINKLQNYLTK